MAYHKHSLVDQSDPSNEEVPIIAWDSGGGSFQLTSFRHTGTSSPGARQTTQHFFPGPWGSSQAVACMVRDIQKKSMRDAPSANPATEDECVRLLLTMDGILGQAPSWILDDFGHVPPPPPGAGMTRASASAAAAASRPAVVSIGGPTSMFNLVHVLTGKCDFSKEDVWEGLQSCLHKTDAELEQRGLLQPGMVVPKLVLCYSVLRLMQFEHVRFFSTVGGCAGVLLTHFGSEDE